jgi:hypothetical protein
MVASLDKRIADLETEIEEYRVWAREAETSEERNSLFELITVSENTLDLFLVLKSEQGKKFVEFSFEPAIVNLESACAE